MRLGVKVGPFYASTGTRRRRRGNSVGQLLFGILFIGAILVLPLGLAQNSHDGFYWWGWLLLPPWWFILFIAWGIYLKAKDNNRASKDSAPGDAPDSARDLERKVRHAGPRATP